MTSNSSIYNYKLKKNFKESNILILFVASY